MPTSKSGVGRESSSNQAFDKVQQGVADSGVGGPLTSVFHKLGSFGENTVAGAVGGERGGVAGQVFFDPIGAGLSLLGGDNDRQRDVADVDPNQAARLREIDRTRKQISQGTDPLTQQRISEMKKAGETTKGQLAKFSGGDVGGTISSFLRAQRNTGQGVNKAFSEGQARIPFFENLSTQLGNRMSQRKLELDIHRVDQERAEAAQAKTVENLNKSGAEVSGDTGLFGGIIDAVGGGKDGKLSNIMGGGIGGSIGQGENGDGGLAGILGNNTGDSGGGGAFGNIFGGGGDGNGFGGILNSGKEAGGGAGGGGGFLSKIMGSGGGEGGNAAGGLLSKVGSIF